MPVTVIALGTGLAACGSSGSATNTASTTPPPSAGANARSPQQTAVAWFGDIDAKNRAADEFLAQPFRNDWAATRTTAWPRFSGVSCQTLTRTKTTATVRCSFSETRFAGEDKSATSWNLHLATHFDGSWVITKYGTA